MQKNNKLEIILVTTKGCVGCEIMFKLLSETLLDSKRVNVNTTLRTFDVSDVNHKLCNDFHDFPTTLFKYNNIIVDKIIGTCTKHNVVNKINNILSSNQA